MLLKDVTGCCKSGEGGVLSTGYVRPWVLKLEAKQFDDSLGGEWA